MMEQELFAAIGGAEDRFLQELEKPRGRRLPRQFGLIAAVIALLLTACAAPAVIRSFDKLLGGNRAESGDGLHIVTFEGGRAVEERFLPTGIDITVEVSEDAPEKIETHYLPLKLLEYAQVESWSDTDGEFSLSLSMKVPRYGRVYGMFYRQYVLPKDGHIHLENLLDSEEWEQSYQSYADVNALVFSGPGRYQDSEGNLLLYNGNWIVTIYTKMVFWSDGCYLYCMRVPVTYSLTASDLEEIVGSFAQVEDISALLSEKS